MISSESQQQNLIDFFHTGKKLKYDKNEYITGSGETPQGVFYIESGIVKSYDITKYNEENLLILRKNGEIIGLTWAITGEVKNIINMALAPTTVWLISQENFIHYFHNNPESFAPIVDTLTNMYRLHSERIMTLEYRTVKERLASFLLTTIKRFGVETANGILIDAPLKQQDIASSICTTRETTSRSLASLQNSNIITIEQSLITIINKDALREIIS